MIKKYKLHISSQDAKDVLGASREAFIYFSFICQFMCTYFVYSILKIFCRATETTVLSANMEGRMFDILSLIISVSNMLMLFGVSDSIKKSVER